MKILYCVKVFFFFHINLRLPSNSSRAVYTEQCQCAEISVCVRSAHFYTERRLVMQTTPAWTGLGARLLESPTWLSRRLLEGTECSVTVIGLSLHSLCIYMCSCESRVDHGPEDCSSHTRHQQNREGSGISLLAVTLEAP